MFKKKKLWVIIGAILVLWVLGNLLNPQSSTENKQTPSKQEVVMNVSKLDTENIKSIAMDIADSDDVEVNVDGNNVDIKIFRSAVLNASSLVKQSARNSVDIFRELYKNPQLNEVWIYDEMLVQDEKGNENRDVVITTNTNRETVEGVDWDNMRSRVINDPTELSSITVGYMLSRVVVNELS